MEERFNEALRLFAERDWDGALAALDEIESTEENHLDLAYLLGLCHARRRDWDEALLYLEQIVTAPGDQDRIEQCRLTLAYVYSVTNRTRLAAYELDALIEEGCRSPAALATRGFAAWAEGSTEEAERWYGEALEIEPENANALNGLGYVLACGGRDPARALTCCRKAVDKAPDNPAYLDSLGWAYHRLGFDDEARKNIERALKLAPDEEEIQQHARALSMDGEERSISI
jgi:tetratricopeptide (TPR) repeat protein